MDSITCLERLFLAFFGFNSIPQESPLLNRLIIHIRDLRRDNGIWIYFIMDNRQMQPFLKKVKLFKAGMKFL